MSEQRTPAAPTDQPNDRTRTLDRRALLGLGAGAALLLAAGARGEAAQPTAKPTPTATPVPVPGYDDPKRWAGRTLHVGAWGGDVQVALRAAVWKPFGAATGCTIAEVVTDYGQLATSVAAKRPYADVLVVDAIWAASAAARPLVQPLDAAVVNPPLVPPLAQSDIALPAYAYAMVGAFRLDAVAGRPPRTWAEWWNRRRFPGNRALQRGP